MDFDARYLGTSFVSESEVFARMSISFSNLVSFIIMDFISSKTLSDQRKCSAGCITSFALTISFYATLGAEAT